jgi:hypothetical protein
MLIKRFLLFVAMSFESGTEFRTVINIFCPYMYVNAGYKGSILTMNTVGKQEWVFKMLNRCCYTTVDSEMAASQNGFCSYKLSIHKKQILCRL